MIRLVDLDEIKREWGINEGRIYRAVALGHIHAYGRPGRQKYYSATEIENWLNWLSTLVSGRQLRFAEFESDESAA